MSAAKARPNLTPRQRAFADVVARVVDAAKARGMSIKDMEQATGLGSTTWYGWIDGRWTRDPTPTRVNAFLDGLGASREDAYRALGWSTDPKPRRRPPAPVTEDPLIRGLKRKLSSPKTTPAEKLMMRRTIAALIGATDEEAPELEE